MPASSTFEQAQVRFERSPHREDQSVTPRRVLEEKPVWTHNIKWLKSSKAAAFKIKCLLLCAGKICSARHGPTSEQRERRGAVHQKDVAAEAAKTNASTASHGQTNSLTISLLSVLLQSTKPGHNVMLQYEAYTTVIDRRLAFIASSASNP
eukprot:20632-Heterococcus_DN1.PRE.2